MICYLVCDEGELNCQISIIRKALPFACLHPSVNRTDRQTRASHPVHSALWQNLVPLSQGMFSEPLYVDEGDVPEALQGYGLFVSQLPWLAKMTAFALGVSC